MANQRITVELDDETLRCLAVLGRPTEVLAQLAHSAAAGVGRPSHGKREQTDESLRVERNKSDVIIESERASVEEAADDVVRIARRRADQVVQTARDEAEGEGRTQSVIDSTSARARTLLEHERSDADAVLKLERAEAKGHAVDSLASERQATDEDLTGERSHADTLLVDQREANARMICATIEADVARERAEESERKLREVAQFREMFIGMLGHDLRNPLGSISIAAAALIQRGHLGTQDAETATRIIRSSQRMTRLIAQLLDLTRARLGGGLPIEPKPTDLREVCRNIVGEFEAGIRLEVEGEVTGNWDEDRLAEAISNITGNALEYATPGTVVTVKAHADEAEAVVEISNQGEPIPADVLPLIFEPFRRAKQNEKSKAGNLGLGLYIAHQIVLSHGGALEAHSAGGTTTFVIRLPRRRPPTANQ